MFELASEVISKYYGKYLYDNTFNSEDILQAKLDYFGGGNCISFSFKIKEELEKSLLEKNGKIKVLCIPCIKHMEGLEKGLNHLVVAVMEEKQLLLLESSAVTAAYPFIVKHEENEQTDENLKRFTWKLQEKKLEIFIKGKLACECFFELDYEKEINKILSNVEKIQTRLVTKRDSAGSNKVVLFLNKDTKCYTCTARYSKRKFQGNFDELLEEEDIFKLLGLNKEQEGLLKDRIKSLK
eukprot:gene6184-10193_t